MASVVSAEEIENLNKNLKSTRARVRKDPKEALRVLKAAGIVTSKGKLASRYMTKRDK